METSSKPNIIMKKVSFIALAFVFFYSCEHAPSENKNQEDKLKLKVTTLKKQNVSICKEYPARLEGEKSVEIRPKITGIIQKMYIDEGQQVEKGQLLFRLETNTIDQEAIAAKAQIHIAQLEVDRLRPLAEKKIIGNTKLLSAQAKLVKAKSEYDKILANMEYASIKSPIAGLVGLLPFKEGSLVSPQTTTPLTSIYDVRRMRAYFSITEKELLDFIKNTNKDRANDKINTPISLILANNDEYPHLGIIELINGRVNPRTGSVQMRAVFENPKGILRHGASGKVNIPVVLKDSYLIPQNVVYSIQNKYITYILDNDNTARESFVEVIGIKNKDYIIKGLPENTRIVAEAVKKIKAGMSIIPLK